MNGLNPFYYLKYLLEKLTNIRLSKENSLGHLLPWLKTLTQEFMSEIKYKK